MHNAFCPGCHGIQGRRLAQSAGYWLGYSYEEGNNPAKAIDAYTKALALFPGSELAPLLRSRLRKLAPGATPAPPPAPAPALAPLQPPPLQPPTQGTGQKGPANVR